MRPGIASDICCGIYRFELIARELEAGPGDRTPEPLPAVADLLSASSFSARQDSFPDIRSLERGFLSGSAGGRA